MSKNVYDKTVGEFIPFLNNQENCLVECDICGKVKKEMYSITLIGDYEDIVVGICRDCLEKILDGKFYIKDGNIIEKSFK